MEKNMYVQYDNSYGKKYKPSWFIGWSIGLIYHNLGTLYDWLLLVVLLLC